MADEQRAIQLQQLASLVIDSYLRRDEAFTPEFATYEDAVFYLAYTDSQLRDSKESGKSLPHLSFWYERSDYED